MDSIETTPAKRLRGRPRGRKVPLTRSFKLGELDAQRLEELASRAGIDHSAVIRQAIAEMAQRMGITVEAGSGNESAE